MPTDAALADLLEGAEAWLADDPDPATRAELAAAIEAARVGEPAAADDLADRFVGMLQFGTAGLRGILGAGPNRMNRAVVIRTAAGLAAYLGARTPAPIVVVGFDARHNSDVFARDTAAVVTAAGGRALLLPRPLPTPVLAFATRHLGADAGVMVTASHNPARDNGYKVYLGDGSQIVPPADVDIAACIDAIASVAVGRPGGQRLDDARRGDRRGLPRRRRLGRRSRDPARALGRPHVHARRRRRDRRARLRAGRLPAAGRRRGAGRAGPRLPDRPLPQPRGAGRDRPRPARSPGASTQTSSSPATPTPTVVPSRCRIRPPRPRATPTAGGCSAATRLASSWART